MSTSEQREHARMSYRLLVVEDDGFTRMLLCSQLRELGHEVVGEAANCAEGLASAAVTRPDAVLVDLDLGSGPNGSDFAHGVRRMLPEVGILLLTTYVDVRLIGDFRPLPAGTVFMVKRALTDVCGSRYPPAGRGRARRRQPKLPEGRSGRTYATDRMRLYECRDCEAAIPEGGVRRKGDCPVATATQPHRDQRPKPPYFDYPGLLRPHIRIGDPPWLRSADACHSRLDCSSSV